jgi:hypothetical protein
MCVTWITKWSQILSNRNSVQLRKYSDFATGWMTGIESRQTQEHFSPPPSPPPPSQAQSRCPHSSLARGKNCRVLKPTIDLCPARRLICADLYLHSPMRLYGVVLNLRNTRRNRSNVCTVRQKTAVSDWPKSVGACRFCYVFVEYCMAREVRKAGNTKLF